MKKDFLAGVIALAQENPTRFVNLIRNGWPEIKAAMDQGHTLKAIHQRLVKGGVRISYRLFTLYVRRLLGKPRKPRGESRHRDLPTAPKVKKSSDSDTQSSAQIGPDRVHHSEPPAKPKPEADVPTDPYENIRTLLYANRPGLQWEEDEPDTTKLY